MSARPSNGVSRRATGGLAELAVLGVMVLWAANFVVVKAVIPVRPAGRVSFVSYAARASSLLLDPALVRGLSAAAAESGAIMLLGALGFGMLPDALDGRPAVRPAPATRRCSSPRRRCSRPLSLPWSGPTR